MSNSDRFRIVGNDEFQTECDKAGLDGPERFVIGMARADAAARAARAPDTQPPKVTQESIQRAIAIVCLWLGGAIGFALATLLHTGGHL